MTSDKWRVTSAGNRNRSGFEILSRHSSLVTRCAFTLIEVMIAMVIFSMVLAAIYSTWLMIMRASRVGQEVAAEMQRQRVTIHTLEDSLTGIQSFQASMQYYSFVVDNGDKPMLAFTAHVPNDFPRSGRYRGFDVRRLIFDVEPVGDSAGGRPENDLVLRQYPILTGMDADEQQTPYVLARNIKSFTVDCWDTNQLDWVDEWDDTNSIPPLIRVSLAFNGKEDKFGQPAPGSVITRVIAVPSQTMPGQVQVPGGHFSGPSGPGQITPGQIPPPQ